MNIIKLLLALFCFNCLLISRLLYADEASVEYKIKAGYLYNFTKFITWPEEKTETFNICILGTDPFGALINPIEQRNAFGHPIKLIRLANLSAPKEAPQKKPRCHILFTSSSIKSIPLAQYLENTLTVGERENFAAEGGMIGFVNRESRIKLQINLKSIKLSGLKVSAKLLEVTEIVEGSTDD